MTPDYDPIDTAWRIHGTVLEWIARAETKASFALTVESAIIAGVVALTGKGRRFGDLDEPAEVATFGLGVLCLFIAVFYAGWVVLPQLRRSAVQAEARQNHIYFGHLMYHDQIELEQALRDKDPLPMLSKQLIVVSKIAWAKHGRVEWSMLSAAVGVFFLVIGFIFATPT